MSRGRCGPTKRGWSARLKTRLLLWFLSAIVLAFVVSSITVAATRPDGAENPTQVVSKRVQGRLSRDWNDPAACARYVEQLREVTGLDFRLVRDPGVLQKRPHRPARGGVVFDEGVAYVPVMKNGAVVGALALHSGGGGPGPIRLFVALAVGVLVLSAVARRVARSLSRPLEQVATAAERFGGGDLSARTGLDLDRRRNIADEVREVAFAFDEMAARIERVVRDQRELLAAISHEIRSPLGRARVGLEIAREDADASLTGALEGVDRELRDVDAILGDLLAAARAGLSDVRVEVIDLFPWLRARLATLSRPDLAPLELVGDEGAKIRIAADAALLGRALANLVNNAATHGHPPEEPLTVVVEHDSAEVRVFVRDRGPGIPPELLPRVFEPFVKGDGKARTPSRGAGTGLGLALVLRIAEAHGGHAFARNVGPEGAVLGAEVGLALPRLSALPERSTDLARSVTPL